MGSLVVYLIIALAVLCVLCLIAAPIIIVPIVIASKKKKANALQAEEPAQEQTLDANE